MDPLQGNRIILRLGLRIASDALCAGCAHEAQAASWLDVERVRGNQNVQVSQDTSLRTGVRLSGSCDGSGMRPIPRRREGPNTCGATRSAVKRTAETRHSTAAAVAVNQRDASKTMFSP